MEVALAATKALIMEHMDDAKGAELLDAAVKELPSKLQ